MINEQDKKFRGLYFECNSCEMIFFADELYTLRNGESACPNTECLSQNFNEENNNANQTK